MKTWKNLSLCCFNFLHDFSLPYFLFSALIMEKGSSSQQAWVGQSKNYSYLRAFITTSYRFMHDRHDFSYAASLFRRSIFGLGVFCTARHLRGTAKNEECNFFRNSFSSLFWFDFSSPFSNLCSRLLSRFEFVVCVCLIVGIPTHSGAFFALKKWCGNSRLQVFFTTVGYFFLIFTIWLQSIRPVNLWCLYQTN